MICKKLKLNVWLKMRIYNKSDSFGSMRLFQGHYEPTHWLITIVSQYAAVKKPFNYTIDHSSWSIVNEPYQSKVHDACLFNKCQTSGYQNRNIQKSLDIELWTTLKSSVIDYLSQILNSTKNRLYGEKERIQIFLHFFVMVSLRSYHGRPKQVKRQVNLFYLEERYNLYGYS